MPVPVTVQRLLVIEALVAHITSNNKINMLVNGRYPYVVKRCSVGSSANAPLENSVPTEFVRNHFVFTKSLQSKQCKNTERL